MTCRRHDGPAAQARLLTGAATSAAAPALPASSCAGFPTKIRCLAAGGANSKRPLFTICSTGDDGGVLCAGPACIIMMVKSFFHQLSGDSAQTRAAASPTSKRALLEHPCMALLSKSGTSVQVFAIDATFCPAYFIQPGASGQPSYTILYVYPEGWAQTHLLVVRRLHASGCSTTGGCSGVWWRPASLQWCPRLAWLDRSITGRPWQSLLRREAP